MTFLNKKFAVTVSIVVLVVLVLFSIFFWGKQFTSQSPKVRIGVIKSLVSYNYYIAKEKGFLNNLDFEEINFKSSNELLDAMIRQEVDITPVISIIPILSAQNTTEVNIKCYAVSADTIQNPQEQIIAKKDVVLNSPKDFENKKIGVFPGTSNSNILKAFLRNNNVDLNKVEIIPLAPNLQLASLEKGSIDALDAYEPELTIGIQKNGFVKKYDSIYSQFFNPSPHACGVISGDFIQKNPEISKKIVDNFKSSYDFSIQDPIEARKIIGKAFNLDEQIKDKVFIRNYNFTDKIDIENFQKYTDFLYEIDEIKQKVDVKNLIYSN